MATIYMRVKFKIAARATKEDTNIAKETFGKPEGAHVTLELITPTGNPRLEGMLNGLNFSLRTENVAAGTYECDVRSGGFSVSCDAIFKIAVKSQYEDDALDPRAKWAIGGIHLPPDRGIPTDDIEFSEGAERFENVYMNHIRKIEESQIFYLTDVKTSRKKSEVKM